MSRIKLLLDVVSDLRSLADSLQAVAEAMHTGTAGAAGEKIGSETGKENCCKEAGAADGNPSAGRKAIDAGTGAGDPGGEVPCRTHSRGKGAPS